VFRRLSAARARRRTARGRELNTSFRTPPRRPKARGNWKLAPRRTSTTARRLVKRATEPSNRLERTSWPAITTVVFDGAGDDVAERAALARHPIQRLSESSSVARVGRLSLPESAYFRSNERRRCANGVNSSLGPGSLAIWSNILTVERAERSAVGAWAAPTAGGRAGRPMSYRAVRQVKDGAERNPFGCQTVRLVDEQRGAKTE
jgi:hypothetical protein